MTTWFSCETRFLFGSVSVTTAHVFADYIDITTHVFNLIHSRAVLLPEKLLIDWVYLHDDLATDKTGIVSVW